jgi:hypothetical protein
MTPRKIIENSDDGVDVFSLDEDVETMWGCGANYITEQDIEALRSGKVIHFDDGEYAHILYLKGSV